MGIYPLKIGTRRECIDYAIERWGYSGALLTEVVESTICECESCKGYIPHKSDCAVHNEPAERNGKCDCGVNCA